MEKMAIIHNDNYEGRRWIKESEIARATFRHWDEAGFTKNDMGLKNVGENEDGEELFESLDGDFDGQKTFDEIMDEKTDWWAVKYWDGNNYHTLVFEYYSTIEAEIEKLDNPSPAYYFRWNLHFTDGEIVFCTTSNMSGSLSPFFDEDIDWKEIFDIQNEEGLINA
jgi:hypothetical protein